jgi:hypothetical protein
MSANIKASVDGTQAIIGVGGVDQMTVSNAGVVTANSFVGNVTGNISGGVLSGDVSSATVLATGSTTARSLANRVTDPVNVKDFGAVGDGVTDNQTAFQAAINVALAAGGGTIYIPKGVYNFPNTSNAAKLDPGLGNLTFKGDGYTSSILKYWEGTGTDQQGNLFSNVTNNPAKGALIFQDLQIQGSLGTRTGRRGNPMWLDYYSEVLINSCKFYNIAAMAMDFHYCGSFKCIDSHFENIAADGVRARDTLDCLVTGNKFLRTGDDPIALHLTGGTSPPKANPQAERFIVSNNTVVNCAGACVLVSGGRKTIITGNTFTLMRGISVSPSFGTSEGFRPIYDTIISNNSFTDSCFGTTISNFAPQSIAIFSNTKSTASTNNTIPGDYDSVTGGFILPRDYTQSNTYNQSGPRTQNIIIQGNAFSVTRSGVAAFSDFGYGQRNYQGVNYDYAVPENDLLPSNTIAFYGQFENVNVSNNIIKDCYRAIAIEPQILEDANDSPNKHIKNFIIDSNSIYNSQYIGISINTSSSVDNNRDITISNNVINCDPYRLASNSNIDGTYDSESFPSAIEFGWSKGIKIHGNKFKNCCRLIASNSPQLNYISDNIAHCSSPVAVGFNIGNKGIGTILTNNNWVYVIEDSDPTSATYLNVTHTTINTSASIPSSGWYYRGWFVKNTTPSIDANNMIILGWIRLTTGTGHVSGTDWAVARVSNVSPAT